MNKNILSPSRSLISVMKILLVDDEALARERLHGLILELYPNADITEAVNGLEALDKISAFSPDILLLDIRMPGMDGLELANHLLNLEVPPAIVFTTAYQDHALNAFDANAIDYLLKPIKKKRLATAIERASIMHQSRLKNSYGAGINRIQRKHLSAVIQGSIQLIAIKDIYYLKAEQKYVTAAWPGDEVLVNESLVSLEKEFPDYFIRIHRNALVAKNYIRGLRKKAAGHHVIKLINISLELPISRRHLAEIRAILKQH